MAAYRSMHIRGLNRWRKCNTNSMGSLNASPRPAAARTKSSSGDMIDRWIADRARGIELSGVRRVFELGRSLKNPVNLSIGQPHFAVPDPVRAAAHAAIEEQRNGYTLSQGIPELREPIKAWLDKTHGHRDREV